MTISRFKKLVPVFALLCISLVVCKDYYERLGVKRDASVKDIRRAFKKLALKMHPDKNTDDPTAHDKFLEINRAYEVLKDEDLRKKYDQFGEEGLKDQGQQWRKYESWNFYKTEFGLYDEDPEVVTLSTSDFEQSVFGQDIWFVNFYSPRCHHCHDLAPTWRKMAKDLEGVIRIGAVNCWDDNPLCNEEGVRNYPTLIVYPKKEVYTGKRTLQDLLKHALNQITVEVLELWPGNFRKELTSDQNRYHPLVMAYCGSPAGGGGEGAQNSHLATAECLTKEDKLKLASILDKTATVGSVDCVASSDMCRKLGIEGSTVVFYEKATKVKKGSGTPILIEAPKDMANSIFDMLPDIRSLNDSILREANSRLKSDQNELPWLVHFVNGPDKYLELRRLPALVGESINVGRLDCSNYKSFCREHYVGSKYPRVALFKQGGKHEFHHGRLSAHDIAAFAKESATSPVHILGPDELDTVTNSKKEIWIIDFFSPDCPPCKRLLPEWRKAARQMSHVVKFGTVDCIVHNDLCTEYNIRSYPSVIFYNQSQPSFYSGHNTAQDIIEFIEDTLNPLVVELSPSSFNKHVKGKSKEEMWMVDFFAPWCGPCRQLLPEWRKLAKLLNGTVQVGSVDCTKWSSLCGQNGIQNYPTIVAYPMGKSGLSGSVHYNNWMRTASSLQAWAYNYLPSKLTVLDRTSFANKVLKSSEPWVVDFYAPWCQPCQMFMPEFERVARTLEGRVKAGKVDCTANENICNSAGIHSYPTVRFYAGTRKGSAAQGWQGEQMFDNDADVIIEHLNSRLPKETMENNQSNKKSSGAKDEL